MPGYQYLNNQPRMDAIQDIGQTGGGLATALPQLQIQAAAFRQRMALQRAQELLNQQRMDESKARAKLYEGEQKLNELKGTETQARTGEANAQTEHVKGQEERERNIARAAVLLGQSMAGRYLAQQNVGTNAPNAEQDQTAQAIQAAALLSTRDPNYMAQFANNLNPQKMTATRPGEVLVNQQGQPVYTNTQPYAATERGFNLGSDQVHYDGSGQPVATNLNVKATSSGLGPAAQAILDRMNGGKGKPQTSFTTPTGKVVNVGDVYKGYRLVGNDPQNPKSWVAATNTPSITQ